MATVYGIVEGVQLSATKKNIVTPQTGGAPVNVVGEYEGTGQAIGTTIVFGTVPAGCRYRVRQMNFDALGAGSTIAVGIAGSTAGQIAATDTSAAGVKAADKGGWKYAAVDTDIIGTTAGGTITGSVQVEFQYVRGGAALAF